ncbi:AI-2E family transporter [Paraburkholderia rhizosphaerae]|uniref:Putative PurR-regulated permease PerM n=1 Tax=Paraburkholderia rhizosphaerae TaxID=480658 RepID=A0A4R8LWR8_9BURK|nr:AI-2E family transporter [Paraburkholderia rhizosphaerae]TDY51642.1 putative PurR-regulated permease PerM [Paraburkholderia rhizosphaerae]
MKLPLTPQRPSNRVYPPGVPGLLGLTSTITAVVVVCGLYFGREVLMPITLAVLLSFLLAPLVSVLRRLRFGQLPSIFVAVLVALITLMGIGTLIAAQIAQLANALPQYQEAIELKIETVQEKTVGRADALLARAAGALARVTPERPPNPPHEAGRTTKPSANTPLPVEVHEPMPSPLQLAQRVFSPVVGPIETMLIVLVVTIFILLQREDLRDRLIRLFGSRDLHRTTTAINDAANRLSRYFVAQLGVNVGAGSLIAIGLAIIGVPGALMFGVLTALLRFVPYIGTWIAALLAVILAAAIQPQWSMAVATIILFVVVDVVAGQVVEPLLYGHSSGLSPLAVVVAAIFWSWLWGPVGLVLSTPLTLCLVTLGRYAERLKFLTVLLGDQPALTPAQNLYQRLLADDPLEAVAQADRLLKEMPLVQYYDDVAREGLRLARNDALRGVFAPDQLARMNETLLDIVENLEQTPEVPPASQPSLQPPQPGGEAPAVHEVVAQQDAPLLPGMRVVCIAGRGAFDDVASAIAAQLLSRRGLPVSAAQYAQLRKGSIDSAGIENAPILCIVTLDASEASPYLRNLVRRIRERAPGASLVVGIGGLSEREGEGTPTGTVNVNSFADLVEHCMHAATNAAPLPPRLAEQTG